MTILQTFSIDFIYVPEVSAGNVLNRIYADSKNLPTLSSGEQAPGTKTASNKAYKLKRYGILRTEIIEYTERTQQIAQLSFIHPH